MIVPKNFPDKVGGGAFWNCRFIMPRVCCVSFVYASIYLYTEQNE